MFSTVHASFDITGPASDDQGESVAGSPWLLQGFCSECRLWLSDCVCHI